MGERIKSGRLAKGMSQSALGRAVGVTRNAISMWERGESAPSSDRLREVAIVLDLELDWLGTGRRHSPVTKGLPLRGSVAAGVWREIPESQDMDVRSVPVAPDERFPTEAQYALKVEGHSVNRTAPNGALLHCVDIVAAGIEIRQGDLVVVERTRAGMIETTVKRVRRGAGGVLQLWPESTDPAHQKPIDLGGKGHEVAVKSLVIFVVLPVSRVD